MPAAKNEGVNIRISKQLVSSLRFQQASNRHSCTRFVTVSLQQRLTLSREFNANHGITDFIGGCNVMINHARYRWLD